MAEIEPPRPARILALDGLRGLAILMVVTAHYFVPHGEHSGILRFASLLTSGVDLFFVLSGFLLGGILLDNRNASHYFAPFYIRRMFRILPLYFLVLVGVFFLMARPEAGFPWWAYATFLQNILMGIHSTFGWTTLAPTWSLGIEEQFYLLLPLLIRYLPAHYLPGTLVLSILCAPLLRTAIYYQFSTFSYFVLLPCRWDSLLLGVLGAWLWRRDDFRAWLQRQSWFLPALAALLLAGFLLFSAIHRIAYIGSPVLASFGLTWLAVLYLTLVILAMQYETRKGIRSALRLMRPLGMIAYGVYLLHMPVLHFFAGQQVLALTVTLVAASLSFYGIERRLITLGHRWSYR